ncbi:hypothetical protein CEXT_225491 [Caerostris extrusa]|uniref:Uncharacterized protein n=1 Tax=Caerostris extrusa TaxID=172846 RepID=A0AAV4PL22_CAEEX|nr:hypothetical protein CEXT_225491 [Caerostris extrusa]
MDSAEECESKFAFRQSGLFRIREDQVPAAGCLKLQRIKMHFAGWGREEHCFEISLEYFRCVFGFGNKRCLGCSSLKVCDLCIGEEFLIRVEQDFSIDC